jgi:hypothetical protein
MPATKEIPSRSYLSLLRVLRDATRCGAGIVLILVDLTRQSELFDTYGSSFPELNLFLSFLPFSFPFRRIARHGDYLAFLHRDEA